MCSSVWAPNGTGSTAMSRKRPSRKPAHPNTREAKACIKMHITVISTVRAKNIQHTNLNIITNDRIDNTMKSMLVYILLKDEEILMSFGTDLSIVCLIYSDDPIKIDHKTKVVTLLIVSLLSLFGIGKSFTNRLDNPVAARIAN
jgi:hypothetical protein